MSICLSSLAALIPPREHWRLYGEFAEDAAFFDIETDGREHQRPTVVSVFARGDLQVFIQGRNLDQLVNREAQRHAPQDMDGLADNSIARPNHELLRPPLISYA